MKNFRIVFLRALAVIRLYSDLDYCLFFYLHSYLRFLLPLETIEVSFHVDFTVASLSSCSCFLFRHPVIVMPPQYSISLEDLAKIKTRLTKSNQHWRPVCHQVPLETFSIESSLNNRSACLHLLK